jgi:hypothetical protein
MRHIEEDTAAITNWRGEEPYKEPKGYTWVLMFIICFFTACIILLSVLVLKFERENGQLKQDLKTEKGLRLNAEKKFKEANGKLIEIGNDPLWQFYERNAE